MGVPQKKRMSPGRAEGSREKQADSGNAEVLVSKEMEGRTMNPRTYVPFAVLEARKGKEVDFPKCPKGA